MSAFFIAFIDNKNSVITFIVGLQSSGADNPGLVFVMNRANIETRVAIKRLAATMTGQILRTRRTTPYTNYRVQFPEPLMAQ
jgi:hypothetical protein